MYHRSAGLAVLAAVGAGLGLAQVSGSEADVVLGVWLTGDGKAKVEVYRCDENYCGRIIWLRDPLKEGKPAVDDKNPEEQLRGRPVLGLTLMREFAYEGDRVWSGGKVYDPESGNDYSGKITLTDESTLDLRGYVLLPLFGRTETWKRVTEPVSPADSVRTAPHKR